MFELVDKHPTLRREITHRYNLVEIPILFYNRDTSRFANPDELDFDRNRNPHLAFGIGVHRCLGRHFARMQLEIGIDRLLDRLTGFRLAPGAPVRRSAGISVGAPRELRLRFDRVAP